MNRPAQRWPTHSSVVGCMLLAAVSVLPACAADVYFNDFNAALGTKYPEWTSSSIVYRSAADPPGSGELAPPDVITCESPNGAQRFLGEFGGPKIGTAADPGYNRTLVEQTIRLTLRDLPPHQSLRVSFDLYVLKSWDGNSPQYGPDKLRISIVDGNALLDSSFSNNRKVDREGSYQDFPEPKSDPQADAVHTDTLAYEFFGDAIYQLDYTFPHERDRLELDFASSLFEGKGPADESWGIDNVRVQIVDKLPTTQTK